MLARFYLAIKSLSAFVAVYLLLPASVFAADPGNGIAPLSITLKPIIGFSSINQAANTLISIMFLGAALLAFFYIVRGALKYVSAGDNSANTQAARTTIQNAVIGLIIIASVYVIFRFVVSIIPGLGALFA